MNRFVMQGGLIDVGVTLGDGADQAEISGGRIGGVVETGDGNDVVVWSGGGLGGIDMGRQNDLLTLRNLTEAVLPEGLVINGGPDTDRLVFDHTTTGDVSRYLNWETVEVTNGSTVIFRQNRTFVLGDSGTGTGVMKVDATSTLAAGGGAHGVAPFDASMLARLENAGTIDLTNGGRRRAAFSALPATTSAGAAGCSSRRHLGGRRLAPPISLASFPAAWRRGRRAESEPGGQPAGEGAETSPDGGIRVVQNPGHGVPGPIERLHTVAWPGGSRPPYEYTPPSGQFRRGRRGLVPALDA